MKLIAILSVILFSSCVHVEMGRADYRGFSRGDCIETAIPMFNTVCRGTIDDLSVKFKAFVLKNISCDNPEVKFESDPMVIDLDTIGEFTHSSKCK